MSGFVDPASDAAAQLRWVANGNLTHRGPGNTNPWLLASLQRDAGGEEMERTTNLVEAGTFEESVEINSPGSYSDMPAEFVSATEGGVTLVAHQIVGAARTPVDLGGGLAWRHILEPTALDIPELFCQPLGGRVYRTFHTSKYIALFYSEAVIPIEPNAAIPWQTTSLATGETRTAIATQTVGTGAFAEFTGNVRPDLKTRTMTLVVTAVDGPSRTVTMEATLDTEPAATVDFSLVVQADNPPDGQLNKTEVEGSSTETNYSETGAPLSVGFRTLPTLADEFEMEFQELDKFAVTIPESSFAVSSGVTVLVDGIEVQCPQSLEITLGRDHEIIESLNPNCPVSTGKNFTPSITVVRPWTDDVWRDKTSNQDPFSVEVEVRTSARIGATSLFHTWRYTIPEGFNTEPRPTITGSPAEENLTITGQTPAVPFLTNFSGITTSAKALVEIDNGLPTLGPV